MKNVFPEITKNFCIGQFLTSIVKFGERARKPNQPLWSTYGLTVIWDFDQGLLCKSVHNQAKHA
jgi:hypothetical protein